MIATVRPMVRESLRISGTVVHVHLTGERPLVFFDDFSTWIGPEIDTGSARLTEDGGTRLLEDGDDRLLEV